MEKIKYVELWAKYKESNDYRVASRELLAHGIKYPYLDNILECAFRFGYNNEVKEKNYTKRSGI